MAKFREAEARIFRNVFICRTCKSKVRGNPQKIRSGEIRCRKCGGTLRPKKREIRKGV